MSVAGCLQRFTWQIGFTNRNFFRSREYSASAARRCTEIGLGHRRDFAPRCLLSVGGCVRAPEVACDAVAPLLRCSLLCCCGKAEVQLASFLGIRDSSGSVVRFYVLADFEKHFAREFNEGRFKMFAFRRRILSRADTTEVGAVAAELKEVTQVRLPWSCLARNSVAQMFMLSNSHGV